MSFDDTCEHCGCDAGSGTVDSGGFTPWGEHIRIPCPECSMVKMQRLAAIGAAWERDSSLEKWFPLTAERIGTLEADLKSAQKARDEWLWSYSVVDFVLKGTEGWRTAKEHNGSLYPLLAVTNAKKLRAEWMSLVELCRQLEPWTAHHAHNARTVSEYADTIYKACIRLRPFISDHHVTTFLNSGLEQTPP